MASLVRKRLLRDFDVESVASGCFISVGLCDELHGDLGQLTKERCFGCMVVIASWP